MTLGEGKRKVLMLLDEYSSGGTVSVDSDLACRMTDFFDLAQKNVAAYKRMIRRYVPQRDKEVVGVCPCPAPADFSQLFRVWRDGQLTVRYPWSGTEILLTEGDVGRVTVEYFAQPATIPQAAPDDYVFEVGEDAAACMPYFVAAQQLVSDLVTDHRPLMELYNMMLKSLPMALPDAGGGGVAQRLYNDIREGRQRWQEKQA